MAVGRFDTKSVEVWPRIRARRARRAAGDRPSGKASTPSPTTPAFRRFIEPRIPVRRASRERPGSPRLLQDHGRLVRADPASRPATTSKMAAQYEVPYVRQPERVEPGKPRSSYASTTLDRRVRERHHWSRPSNGRPIKIEGNDRSIPGVGAVPTSSARPRSSPSTIRCGRRRSAISTGSPTGIHVPQPACSGQIAALEAATRARGFAILLTGAITSPSTRRAAEDGHRSRHAGGQAGTSPRRWVHRRSEAASQGGLFGRAPRRPACISTRPRVVVSIDGDILDQRGRRQVGLSRRFMDERQGRVEKRGGQGRSADAPQPSPRHPNLTSAKADHHRRRRARCDGTASSIAPRRRRRDARKASEGADPDATLDAWIDARRRRRWPLPEGRESSCIAGATQPTRGVLEAVYRLNATLGNIGDGGDLPRTPVLPRSRDRSPIPSSRR